MTLTLWRGDRLLGELRLRPSPRDAHQRDRDEPPSLAAILIRVPDAPFFEGVWQIHPAIPGMGVQQHAVDPDIVAERYQQAARDRSNRAPRMPMRFRLGHWALALSGGRAVSVAVTVKREPIAFSLSLTLSFFLRHLEPQRHPANTPAAGELPDVDVAVLQRRAGPSHS
jgi:hypothetical protein